MFCDACGATLQASQGYCVRCGKQVIGTITPGTGRVARHTHLLGILWIAYSVVSLLIGVMAVIFAHMMLGRFGPEMPNAPPIFVRPLMQLVGIFFLCKAGVGIAAGWGLMQREQWARTVAIILGVISLFNVPFGTALGIYTLWVLLSPNADQEYLALRRGA